MPANIVEALTSPHQVAKPIEPMLFCRKAKFFYPDDDVPLPIERQVLANEYLFARGEEGGHLPIHD